MNIFTRFVKSLYSPKEVAKYRFLGIGKTIFYVFILMLISILPSIFHGQLTNWMNPIFGNITESNNDNESYIHVLKGSTWILLPFLFLFLYFLVSTIGFIKISIIAGVGLFFAKLIKTKLSYRQAWRLGAYSITLTTIFFVVMDILKTEVPGRIYIDWAVSVLFLYLTILQIPKPKNAK